MMFDPFHRKKKEQIIHDLASENAQKAAEAAKSAKALRDLLLKNGVTLQILIATGGGRKRK